METIKLILFPLIILMTAIGAFAGFFLKRASANLELKRLLKNHNLYLGVILYLAAAIINIYVLRFLDFSIVLPLTAITYVWTMIISYIALKEKITGKKIWGVGCIILGAFILASY